MTVKLSTLSGWVHYPQEYIKDIIFTYLYGIKQCSIVLSNNEFLEGVVQVYDETNELIFAGFLM